MKSQIRMFFPVLAERALRIKLEREIPGTSSGFWKGENMPRLCALVSCLFCDILTAKEDLTVRVGISH